MYQPVTLYIGLRYMRGRTADRFGRFVSWLSTIGITLGVMALITVLSIMNGFEQGLEKNILSFIPQAFISTSAGEIDPQKQPSAQLDKLQGVNQIMPLTQGDVVLQSSKGLEIGVMLGVDPDSTDPLFAYVQPKPCSMLPAGAYQLVMGSRLAQKLGVQPGDQVRLLATSVSQFTPMGRIPSQRLFTLCGLFNAGSEVDDYQLLVNIEDASRLLHYPPGHIGGWRLLLQQPLLVAQLDKQLLPPGLVWQDWRARKGELFQAVSMERNMMALLLSLIIAVAAFNIVTSLGLLVMEKQAEVAILQTQGLTPRQIMAIFMIQGAGAGMIGSLLGAVAGVVLASNINTLFPFMGGFLGGTELPAVIEPLQVIFTAGCAMLIALLSTLYPSWRAAAIQPAEALRYE